MSRNHAKLICDVGELTGLFTNVSSLDAFLQQIVDMIANHMQADVCSIYLYFDDTEELVLKATKGLKESAIGTVRMKLGEGLTGMALKEMRPIYVKNVHKNQHYKFFPDIGEEEYESFLAVPIVRGKTRIGVVVIQSRKRGFFTEEDMYAFRAVTAQLANTVETTRFLINVEERQVVKKEQVVQQELKCVKGRPGSPGAVVAPLSVINHDEGGFLEETYKSDRQFSKDDFLAALKITEEQINTLQNQVEETLFDVASLIFTAQLLMLKDKAFIDAMMDAIDKGVNPPEAVHQVVMQYVLRFNQMDNAYIREKAHDIRDVGKRLIENLTGVCMLSGYIEGHVVIAQELLPSDTLKLYSQKIKGIILTSGGVTSHLAILCRSLHLPLVITDERRLFDLPQNTEVYIDGDVGEIHINPEKEIKEQWAESLLKDQDINQVKATVTNKTCTRDGHRIKLLANINLLADLRLANDFLAEGVGLYRTEFPFMARNNYPTEEDQFVIYRRLVNSMPNKEITFRSLDIGGDKVLSYSGGHAEENPFLGLRSIRFSLQNPDIFKEQIKAILRAGYDANIKLMFPMISSLDEFLQTKTIMAESMRELRLERAQFARNVKLGVMIELPSAVEIIDDLAKEVDFFSIGTNDLIQYMLAVDRTNDQVARWYLPHHPAILKALQKIMISAKKHRRPVTICGEMAHNVKYIPFLLGIGIHQLSLDARYIPRVQKAIQRLSLKQTEKFAQKLLMQRRIEDVTALLQHVDELYQ